jgi:hypothetical protein
MANVLVKSFKLNCHHEVLNIISVLSSGVWKLKAKENHFAVELQHRKFYSNNCDLNTISNVYEQYIRS